MMNKMVDEIDRRYKTLGRDIKIYRRDQHQKSHLYHNDKNNTTDDGLDGRWDRAIDKGDFIQVKGDEAVYNAITLSVLTAYKELENKGLKTYTDYGNQSYELLKENKNKLTLFKLESYFTKAINRIRRVREVVKLNIKEYTQYSFDINFTVYTIEDTIVSGNIGYDKNRILSHCTLQVNISSSNGTTDYIGPEEYAIITCKLTNIRGSGLPDKTIRLYLDDESYNFKTTNDDGETIFYIRSNDLTETRLYDVNIVFEGDNDFYGVETGNMILPSTQYRFNIIDDNLYLNYNPESDIPEFKLEDGDLYVDETDEVLDYLIDNGYLKADLQTKKRIE